jgi:hypothetical protein
MFFGFLETVAGKASAVIDTTVALAGYLSLARTLQKIHALLADPGDFAEDHIGQCCPKGLEYSAQGFNPGFNPGNRHRDDAP